MSLVFSRDLDALSGLVGYPSSSGTASQVLEYALDLLATPDAWCKGAAEQQTADVGVAGVRWATKRCLVGATRRALLDTGHLRTEDGTTTSRVVLADDVARRVARRVADAVLHRHPGAASPGGPGLLAYPGPCTCTTCTQEDLPGEAVAVRFNDHPVTTHDQVLEVLKDARGLALDDELREGCGAR